MCSFQRYLMYISYVGSGFSGSQIQNAHSVRNALRSVQGTLEDSLGSLFKLPKKEFLKVTLSSRTDAGVHALRTGVHFDLPLSGLSFKKQLECPKQICKKLNHSLKKQNVELRVLSVFKVPDSFHARYSALEKVYIYRIAVPKENHFSDIIYPSTLEMTRTYFVRFEKFDVDKLREALNLFIGEKDFGGFSVNLSKNTRTTICNIKSFTCEPSTALMTNIDTQCNQFDFYQFTCIGNRFLYKMVRRMIGALLEIGKGKLTLNDIQLLFDDPTNTAIARKIVTVPGHALYLSNVSFNSEHLIMTEEEKKLKEIHLECIGESTERFSGLKNFCEKIEKTTNW